ncbi:hypothetical protein Tco_1110451 [Tanacetum coccineum]|uniref:Synaptobrevin, longin-like domain protein n=1 Tax=Tanacetum coccineum TaxID=301880 RepID=A0ABQ5IIZ4_9ASTR
MAALKYRDEHNKVGYMEKPKGSDDYYQVLDFLRGSHLRYALTHDPIIFDSLVKQFWSTASLRAPELGPPAILATIDRTPYTITEDTVRSQLQLGDDGGIEDLPIADIYLGMDNLGYPTEGKLTFHKNKFSPQWRFLVHTIQHCLSTKSGSWDQFGSPLAIALICLSDGRRFNWSSYIFKGMLKCFPHAQAAIADEGTGEAAPDVPQTILETIHETRPEPDQSQEHIPTPQRPTTSDQIPPVFEQGHTSDPNIASFSGAHKFDPNLFTSTNVADATLGGSFHTTPPRSTPVPLVGPTSGGAEDLATLTALSSLVSELVQKVSTLESELQAHKLLFKDVVGKLVKKVKALELKLHTRSRKVVMSESDKEEEEEQDVDPLIKLAKAAAASDAHVDVSPGADIPPSPPLPTGMSVGVSSGVSTGTPACITNKGKSPIMEVDPPVKRRTFRQIEEDRLGEEAAKRLFEEEHADLERQRAEMQRKRQQDVLDSAKYYTDADWTDIMGQVHANQGLTSDLLGPDVNEDNFAERMVALIAERRRAFAAQRFQEKRNKPMTYAQQKAYMRTFVKNQSTSIYTTGWTMKHVKSLSDEQLKSEFEKIRTAVADLQSQNIRRTLKRAGEDLEHDVSKKPKPTEVPMSSQPDVPQQQATNVPPVDPQQPSESSSQPNVSMSSGPEKKGHTYGTRRKSLGTRKKSSTALDLDADDRSFIRVLSDDDSDDDDDPVIFWSAFATWEVVPTPLGDINALYMMDRSSKYFTHLREILHLVDRQDLLKLYGMVVKYYEDHPLAGAGMMLWGDLQVLFESHEGGHGSLVWSDQQQWHIRSWRLFPFSNVHVLETISGKVVYMFADGSYPLSVQLMKKMLKHKLEIEIDGVGNDMTYAEQLIQFIKNQIAASIPSA